MSIATQIERIQNEVNTQGDLIAQIAAALENKAAGGNKIETYTITFPEQCVGGEKIYYTDENFENKILFRISNGIDTIKVLKNSIVMADSNLWYNNTTYVPDKQENMLNIGQYGLTVYGYGFIVKGDINFSYADGAPQ